jgi:hypothetical protein
MIEFGNASTVVFKEVKYITRWHIFRKIYDKYNNGWLINYDIFKSNVRDAENYLIYKDNEEIGFVSFVYKSDTLMVYIHYLTVIGNINIKKELYNLLLTKGYYFVIVCYYRIKKRRFFCYHIKH